MRKNREEPDDIESGEGWSEDGLLGDNDDGVELDEDIPRGRSGETSTSESQRGKKQK
jgi:hypothetical protein